MRKNWSYSDLGPVCPHCGYQYNARDDDAFYDPHLMTELDCENCGEKFNVEVERQTTWSCYTKA
jgi:hypothetical protein